MFKLILFIMLVNRRCKARTPFVIFDSGFLKLVVYSLNVRYNTHGLEITRLVKQGMFYQISSF